MRAQTYRLARQIEGRGSFAEVTVSQDVAGDALAALQRVPREWVDAARSGLAGAIAAVGGERPAPALERVVFTFVDTTEDAVFAAAFMAAVGYLGEAEKFRPCRSEGAWAVSGDGRLHALARGS